MADENTLESKISTTDAIIMVIFALAADVCNMIPGLNFIVSTISLVGFQFAFWMRGFDKTGYNLAGNLMDVIPFLSILPSTTAGVMMTIHVQWKKEAKDRENLVAQKNKKTALALKKSQLDQLEMQAQEQTEPQEA